MDLGDRIRQDWPLFQLTSELKTPALVMHVVVS